MASKRRQRRYTCERKVRHATKADAVATFSGAVNSVYACGHCGGWHVGHPPGFRLRGRGLKGHRL